jgi:hypothetical protein
MGDEVLFAPKIAGKYLDQRTAATFAVSGRAAGSSAARI